MSDAQYTISNIYPYEHCSNGFMPKNLLISLVISLAVALKILKTILFLINLNDCKSAEFIVHAIPYKKIGKNDLANTEVAQLFVCNVEF